MGGKEFVFFQFNVVGIDNINWFLQNNFVQLLWSDLKGVKNFLNFVILGVCCLCGFEIIVSYGGCFVDVGWFVIIGFVCFWEIKYFVFFILYSKQSYVIIWY